MNDYKQAHDTIGYVSIIIPAYNVEKTLEHCVRSALDQTYQMTEIIIIDDGSTDNTPKIADSLAKRYERCSVIHQRNLGLSGARNTGIAASKGEYLFFLDSDDYLGPNEIEALARSSESTGSPMAVGGLTSVDNKGMLLSKHLPDSRVFSESDYWRFYYASPDEWPLELIVSWGKLFKKSLFNDNLFDVGRVHEDEFIIHRLVSRAGRIVAVPIAEYYYVQNAQSIMHNQTQASVMDGMEAVLDRAQYFKDIGLIDCSWKIVASLRGNELLSNIKSLSGLDQARAKMLLHRCRTLYAQLRWKSADSFSTVVKTGVFVTNPRLYAELSTVKGHSPVHIAGMLVRLAAHQRRHQRSVILISTPTHGNLGDQAIVLAERRFFHEMGFGEYIFEIERKQYEPARKQVAALVRPSDLIVIDGGGNVGTLWPEENAKMNDIVTRFSNNSVVVFPQTAYFEDSAAGRTCKNQVWEAYSKNPHLIFFSRDEPTYWLMNDIVPALRNYFVPDVVMSLDRSGGSSQRNGALLCLREDKERTVSMTVAAEMRNHLETRGFTVRETSTVVSDPPFIDQHNRNEVLEAKWNEFRSAEIVVTDRLHGMLFSVITGTPCVALDNVSHKVSNGFLWVHRAGVSNVKIATSPDEVPSLLDEVLAEGPAQYDPTALDRYFDVMREVISDAFV